MIGKDLGTGAPNTWCPGCGNFAILNAMRAVMAELNDADPDLTRTVLVSGIGCHGKIADYINVNSFYSIHGRATPAAEGIKIADPGLRVICHSGDGDAYGEGLEHLVFAAKRNIDMTMIVHDNRVYGLTTGQYTPTSPFGFKGRSTPAGSLERPLNPLTLMLTSGASFVARGYSHGIENLKDVFRAAVAHKGFSFVDVLQVCVTYFNQYEDYTARTYALEKEHDISDYDAAFRRAREWDYNSDARIPLGVFYQREAPGFEIIPAEVGRKPADTRAAIDALLADYR